MKNERETPRGAGLLAIIAAAGVCFAADGTWAQGVVTLRAAPAQSTAAQPELSAEAIAELKEEYDAATDEEKEQMVAMFKDMGIDLLALFGQPAEAGGAVAPPAQTLTMAIQAMDFSRTPQKVLEARAQLGLQAPEPPAEDAEVADVASWLHKNVMAGEWDVFGDFVRERAGEEAEPIYAHVLQSTNQGDPSLLPEEVLAISEAAPAELTDWQLDTLAQLLKTAAAKSSTGPLLERIKEGTTYFGLDDEKRARTAKFLSTAGLAVEAYGYLPALEEARASGDAQALLDHARYQAARAQALGSSPDADGHRRLAWDLFCEVTLIDGAEFEQRRSSLQSAVDLLPSVPPGPATAWLAAVFANKALAPAAIEAVALKAMAIGNSKMDEEARAQAILTMKEAVDTLLDNEDVDIDQLRVPLRMLTMGLIAASEETIEKRAPEKGVAADTALLLRALPGERWRGAIEPSLAVRAYKSFIGIALVADDTDLALDLVEDAVARAPGQGAELADDFLRLWMLRLNPPQRPNQNIFYVYIGGSFRQPSAPLTRGRQRRNLERLTQLLDVLDSIDVDGRKIERVVEAFGTCHGRAETYKRESVLGVLGPIEELAPSVSSRLAEAMRTGLNGDWRSRDVQSEEGNQRSTADIDALVEEGYALAQELIDSAIAKEPDSWRHAMTKTALVYDLMQFRSERDQDAASYNTARADLFRSFGQAAAQYRGALERGEIRADPSVYVTWFSISLGSSTLAGLKAEDLLTEGAENADQIELIRNELLAMSPDAAKQHIGEFARIVVGSLGSLTPEVKPGVVRRAVAIVGDDPAGAPLRRTQDLYDDLVSEEIKLRLTLDGSDRVGTKPFGAVLTLRYTANIEREVGGFQQYLQNNVWTAIGGTYQIVNLRDRLEKSIEQQFDGEVELIELGFFDSMNPAEPIKVEGEGGWQEKPIAYLVLRATDESADHLPALQMDLNLLDTAGPVVLPVQSNTVLIDAVDTEDRPARKAYDMTVTQTLDARALQKGEDSRIVKLEVTAVGRGVLPDIKRLVEGYEDSLAGYRIADDGIEERPLTVTSVEPSSWNMWYSSGMNEESDTYVKPDEDGVFRMTTSRSWVITYEPAGGSVGKTFQLPVLVEGVDGTLVSERYDDMDLVTVSTAWAPIEPRSRAALIATIVGLLAIVLLGVGAWIIRRRGLGARAGDEPAVRVPEHVTPLTAMVTLQRIEREYGARLGENQRGKLREAIEEMEQSYFAEDKTPDGQVAAVLHEWVGAVRGGNGSHASR